MELETLEVLIEANLEKMEEQFARIMPFIDKTMAHVERVTGQGISKTENNMSLEKGTKLMTAQFEKMTKTFEKQMSAMNKAAESGSQDVGKNMSAGFSKARKNVGKDVDAIINEINSKMGQAKAQQEKLAFLRTQRQGTVSSNDTKGTVKYDEQIARAQAAMTKYQDSAKGLARSIQDEFNAVPASLDNITQKMAQNEGQIEKLRSRIKLLQAEYANQKTPVGNFQDGFKNIGETKTSTKTAIEIDKQSAKMQKLIANNDGLQKAYAMTEDRATQLKSALSGINAKLAESSVKTGTAAEAVKKTGNSVNESRNNFSRFGGLFNRTSNNIAHGTRRMSNGMGQFGNRISGIVKQVFIFGLITKGLQLMSRGLMMSLKTNDQFASSLNQIKVNLLTAFYPIYTAILPAINALMSVVAKATGILASFIATLFGTTYNAAKQGAQGLYQNIQAMNDSGNAADKNKEKIKKLQRSLMGFDEINKIGLEEPEEDKTSNIDFNTPNFDVPSWAAGANQLLTDFFKPFQDSWAKHGQKVISAWKYALSEVWGLVTSIGRSFMEVWTNGSGERLISNLLLLLTNVLNLIGDIARAFKNAWNDEGRGTALIQSFFDMWNKILELINEIGYSFRNVWNNGTGERIAANILEIYTNVNNTIGNIAESFKTAWKEGSAGEKIFQGVLDVFDIVLETINKMTKSTAEWGKKLDFKPLLKSIDRLLQALKPLTKNIGDGLAWLLENVLLPLADFVITDLIPAFIDELAVVLEIINGVINTVKPAFKFLWDYILKPLAEFTGGMFITVMKQITKALQTFADFINSPKADFSDFIGQFGELGLNLISGLFEGIVESMTKVGTFLLEHVFNPIVDGFKKLFGIHSPSTVFAEFGMFLIEGLVKGISDLINKAVETITGLWTRMKEAVVNKTQEIFNSSKEKWQSIKQTISDSAEGARKWTTEKWESLKKKTGEVWENVKTNTRTAWDEVSSKVRTSAESARDKASGAWQTMKDKVSGFNESIKSTTKTAFDSVASWAGNLGKRMGEGLAKGFEAVKNGAKSLGKGVIEFPLKAVNGVISGVSWVLEKVGASSAAKSMKAYQFNYAKGTNYHPGGRALVNDGSGMNYQEAYRLPNGQTGVFPKVRNMVVDLPAGSSVLSGPKTAKMMTSDLPMYANGVGDWFKEKWNGIKEFSGDVWDYVSNPGKLLEVGISKFTNLGGALDPGLSMAKGAISTTASAATDFVKSKMDEFLDSGSGHDGSIGDMGVYSYLSDVAKKVINRFPAMRMTSGMREGDPYYHGKRQAIDIAFPSSMNGSPENTKAANYAFDSFASKVGYVITNGRVRDRSGMSGTGTSGQWKHWPDNDHYDHVHINGLLGAADVGKGGGGSSPGGTGVERWRSTIQRALAKNGLPTNATYTNAWLRQVQSESGGNEKAVQGGYVDVNTLSGDLAKGLLQTISATFNAYKHSGFGNIFKGYDNSLAAINYAKNRYGSSGMLQVIGHGHGYAKGTPWVPEDQLAMIHKGEMVVPAQFNPNNPTNNYQDFSTLQLPDMFTQKPKDFTYKPSGNQSEFRGGGLEGMSNSLIKGIMLAIETGGGMKSLPPDGDLIINVGGKEFGRIAVSEINKYHEQIGHTELNL